MPMKKFILGLAVWALILGFASSSKANNNDPDANKYKIASINWIKTNIDKDNKDIDDKYVVLIGKVTKRIDDDTFLLDDGTGTIELHAWNNIELPIGKRVVVRGDIDDAYWDVGNLEVDVVSWRLENKHD